VPPFKQGDELQLPTTFKGLEKFYKKIKENSMKLQLSQYTPV
jgi:hypothetical protein